MPVEKNLQRAFFSPPPCGEGSGVGVGRCGAFVAAPRDPPPRPSPTRGEGAEAPCVVARRRNVIAALSFVALAFIACAAPAPAAAETWPDRPVRVIVPHAAGGMPDILGRIVAEHFTTVFHQQFYVEDRAGGNGVVGAAMVRALPPDGYNLIVTSFPVLVVQPLVNPNAGFEPLRDFTHIAYFGGAPNLFVVNPALGVHSLKELVAYVRRAGSLAYATSGPGSNGQLVGESFARHSGITLTPVGYRSGSIGLMDAVAGHVPMSSQSWGLVGEYVRAGRMLPLAVTSEERLSQAPEVPTFKEEGYPDLVTTTWFSLSGPRGLPDAITNALNREAIVALHRPDIRERLERDAVQADPLTPAEFTAFLAKEITRWTPLVRESGITVE
jgi:tripartite-type tricarboxylate transporter receptor subunit TctC